MNKRITTRLISQQPTIIYIYHNIHLIYHHQPSHNLPSSSNLNSSSYVEAKIPFFRSSIGQCKIHSSLFKCVFVQHWRHTMSAPLREASYFRRFGAYFSPAFDKTQVDKPTPLKHVDPVVAGVTGRQ